MQTDKYSSTGFGYTWKSAPEASWPSKHIRNLNFDPAMLQQSTIIFCHPDTTARRRQRKTAYPYPQQYIDPAHRMGMVWILAMGWTRPKTEKLCGFVRSCNSKDVWPIIRRTARHIIKSIFIFFDYGKKGEYFFGNEKRTASVLGFCNGPLVHIGRQSTNGRSWQNEKKNNNNNSKTKKTRKKTEEKNCGEIWRGSVWQSKGGASRDE